MDYGIGSIVHYVSNGSPHGRGHGSECRAAIVTQVYTAPHYAPDGSVTGEREYVGLAVLNPTGMFFNGGVEYDEGYKTSPHGDTVLNHKGGTWHMPCTRIPR